MRFRRERMARIFLEALNKIFQRELEVPGALITITAVELSRDLARATARIAILPKEKEAAAMKSLAVARKHFQHLLTQALDWRLIPEILFELDQGAENAARVEKALLEAADQRTD